MQKNTVILPETLCQFDTLPDAAHVRLPTVKALLGVSQASIWRGVAAGKIPKPRKLTPKTSAWNVGELRAFLAGGVR